MTNQQILERAITKAIDGGWDEPLSMTPQEIAKDCTARLGGWHTSQIIFSHDFAKALWGQKNIYVTGEEIGDGWVALLHPVIKKYLYHLQQMVIADDPIKYLGDHLDD